MAKLAKCRNSFARGFPPASGWTVFPHRRQSCSWSYHHHHQESWKCRCVISFFFTTASCSRAYGLNLWMSCAERRLSYKWSMSPLCLAPEPGYQTCPPAARDPWGSGIGENDRESPFAFRLAERRRLRACVCCLPRLPAELPPSDTELPPSEPSSDTATSCSLDRPPTAAWFGWIGAAGGALLGVTAGRFAGGASGMGHIASSGCGTA